MAFDPAPVACIPAAAAWRPAGTATRVAGVESRMAHVGRRVTRAAIDPARSDRQGTPAGSRSACSISRPARAGSSGPSVPRRRRGSYPRLAAVARGVALVGWGSRSRGIEPSWRPPLWPPPAPFGRGTAGQVRRARTETPGPATGFLRWARRVATPSSVLVRFASLTRGSTRGSPRAIRDDSTPLDAGDGTYTQASTSSLPPSSIRKTASTSRHRMRPRSRSFDATNP